MYKLMSKYGIGSILKSGDVLSLVIGFFVLPKLIVNLNLENEIELIRSYSTIIISISTGMLALTITVLSIIIGMMNDKFIEYIKKSDSYYQFVVPFYLNSLFWIIGIIVNIIIFVLTYSNYILNYKNIAIYIISFSISLFLACLIGVKDLVCTSIELGKYKIRSIKIDD